MINNPKNLKFVFTLEENIKAVEDKIKNNSDELIVFDEKSSVRNGMSDFGTNYTAKEVEQEIVSNLLKINLGGC